MKNPWRRLPKKPPYVLPEDEAAITKYNKLADPRHRIWLEFLPVPFVGNVTRAKIVLLQLNPSVSMPPGFDRPNNEYKRYPELKRLERKNLLHGRSGYPFIYLDPVLRGTGGFRYWTRRLKPLLRKPPDYQRLAKMIACVELFPYHSKRHRAMKDVMESQKYGFWLVQEAIKRGAVIVIMRARRRWLHAVPDLKGHHLILRNPRNVVVNARNMPKGQFRKIKDILRPT